MGIVFGVIEAVGGTMAGLGANLVAQGTVTQVGMRYANNKFMKACVGCASWAVGCYANKRVTEMFVDEVKEVEAAVDDLKKVVLKLQEKADENEKEDADGGNEREA